MIIIITLPITLHKMKKVDYDSYYLGYAFVKDISANVLPDLLKDYNEEGGNEEDEPECAFIIGNTCYGTPFKPTPMTYAECAGENATSANTTTAAGTEASALGIKECYYENDYWVGAVKACGGTQNMPTLAQLAEIANYIYNTDQVTAKTNVTNLTQDDSKVSAMGFISSSGTFYVYSGEETSSRYAYDRGFYSLDTYWNVSPSRGVVNHQAVCIVN